MISFFDVADIITDPDFVTTFAVIRRTESTDDNGRSHVAEELLSGRGVIQPATPEERERLPEGDTVSAVMAVYSQEPLLAGDEAGCKPDIIAYLGKEYEVKSVEDWRNNGAGYSKALAVML